MTLDGATQVLVAQMAEGGAPPAMTLWSPGGILGP